MNPIIHLEDDPQWSINIRQLLSQENLIVWHAPTVEKAGKLYGDILKTKTLPKLVILDISLDPNNQKNQDGFALINALKFFDLTRETSLIILSENDNRENLIEILQKYRFDVLGVFGKSDFRERIPEFMRTVKNCINKISPVEEM